METVALSPEAITSETVRDADALIIRTRTRCDAALLDGSRVQFIATATIGFDHIDRDYCRQHGIVWTNCPGCNAQGVCDYVQTVLHRLAPDAAHTVLGIVGVGHVGRLVERMAREQGYEVLLCDPPRAEVEGNDAFVTLDEIADRCDVITFHTPLTREGRYPTCHMASEEPVEGQTDGFFRRVNPRALLINAARGGIVDERALLRHGNPCVIDCWEGEPAIDRALLDRAAFATFHIAGYTRMGKYNASQMSLDALCRHFHLPALQLPDRPPEAPHLWDIDAVSRELKAQPAAFELLRSNYKLR